MILCDTNILIEIYRGNKAIIAKVKSIGQKNMLVSDVTRAELLFGARNKTEIHAIKKDMKNLTILPITSSISAKAIELMEDFSLSHRMSFPDALIASTEIINQCELYTLNLKDFKFVPGLKLLK